VILNCRSSKKEAREKFFGSVTCVNPSIREELNEKKRK